MRDEKAQFKFRRINGITDVRLKDSDSLRTQIIRKFRNLAPLLDDSNPLEPTFAELKRNPEFQQFISSQGDEPELILLVSARDGVNIEKAVGILDYEGRVCAAVHWKAEEGKSEFKIFN